MKTKRLFLIPLTLGMLLTSCGNQPAGDNTDYKPVFATARANTASAVAYQYDFSVKAKIKFKDALSFSPAQYSGTTYVKTDNPNTQFLQKRELSGLLLFDSTNYIYNVGTDLIKVSADENKDFSVINHETVSSVYDFDKFNFGHIIKSLNDDHVLGVKKSGDKYNLTLHANFSQDSLLGMLNFIDSSIILKALNAYTKAQWGVNFSVNAWAKFNNDQTYLSAFHFDASVTIRNAFDIGFEFDQTFVKYGNGVSIVLPTFNNTITNESQVTTEINRVKFALQNSKARSTSYYDYKVKTTVDHGVSLSNPLGLAVNSTTQGYTKRQVTSEAVYFNNRLQVDSDYKNADQYGSDLIKDYDSYRARLSNGDVYNVLDPKIGFNQYTLMDGYNNDDIDNYYMLPAESLLSFNNLKVVKKTTDNDGNTTYQFGLTTNAVKDVLDFYNKQIRIDYNEVTVFDIYKVLNEFSGKKALLKYTVNSSDLITNIEMDFKGFYVDSSTNKQVKFRHEVDIDFDYTKSYTAVSKKEDIDDN